MCGDLKERLDQLSQIIRETLTRHRWNKTCAASELACRGPCVNKLVRYGLEPQGLMAWWWCACCWPRAPSWLLPAGAQPVWLGVLAWLGEDRAAAQWAPLLDALASRLPAHSRTHAIWIWMPWTAVRVASWILSSPTRGITWRWKHAMASAALPPSKIAAGHDSAHAVAATVIVPATDK